MKPRYLTALCGALLVSSMCAPTASAQFAHARGTEIVDASGKPFVTRGINLANWLLLEGYLWRFGGITQYMWELENVTADLLGPTQAKAFFRAYRQNFVSEQDVQRIRQDGFNLIRVPLHAKFFQSEDGEGFQLIDQLSAWCRKEHLYLILVLQGGVGGITGEASDDGPGYPWLLKDAGVQQETAAAWRRIARHYRNDPAILGYDLLNEPMLWSGYLYLESLLEPEYRRLTAAIREVDTNHIIILQPALGRFSAFGRPFDANTVYSFHSYGATPRDEFLRQYLDFREKYQVPLLFSEIYTESAPEWVGAHAHLAERHGIGWVIWPYKKMSGDSTAPYIFPSPAAWPRIITFAHTSRTDRDIADKNAVRPDQKDIDAMFAELLENVKDPHITEHPEILLQLPGIRAH